MLPGHFRGHQIAEQSAADPLDLIGGDGYTNTGGTQHDALFALAGSHCPGSRRGKIGIVTGIQGIGSEILHLMALGLQMLHHLILQRQRAMVTADCNFHRSYLLYYIATVDA